MSVALLLLAAVAAWQTPAAPTARASSTEPDLAALTKLCASDLEWAATWDAAVERAQREKRLILVHAQMYPSFAITDEDAVSTLMDRDVRELVLERFVPFRLRSGVECGLKDAAVYGLGALSFGRCFLVVDLRGRVIADGIGDLVPLLLDALRRAPDAGATPVAKLGTALDRAASHVRRGELDAAKKLLEPLDSARGWQLRARVHELERDGERALAAIESARRALRPADGSELSLELDLDEAWLLARVGRLQDAFPISKRILDASDAADPAAARYVREARYLRAELHLALGQKLAAHPILTELARGDAADRWTWRAAGRLTSTHYELGAGDGLAWPSPQLRALTPVFEFDALDAKRASRAIEPALDWMLAHQREDGSWPSTTELGSQMDHELSDLTLATTALGAEALLARVGDARPRRAVERALEYALRSCERLRTTPMPKAFLEYGVWSRAHLLHLVAAACEAGVMKRADAEAAAAKLVDDLRAMEKGHGGWSYYRTVDLKQEASVTPSMSFTTADVVLALSSARTAKLADGESSGALIERGLDAIDKMRGERRDFAYWWAPGMAIAPHETGDSGHGPLCELALARGGRSLDADLARALAAFAAHRRELAAERGKSLMHCGPGGLGSHYVLFDALWAARAADELPAKERKRFREPIVETVLACRTTRGSFVDNPLIGECAGTALALLALEAALE